MTTIDLILLSVLEGLTEFLPISSTGHMILFSKFLNIPFNNFTKLFIVGIQLGAILSVLVLYWKRFFRSHFFYLKIGIATVPAIILGSLFNNFIESLLESPITVCITLILGGFILILSDKWFSISKQKHTQVKYYQALKIGFFQCIAMIPGVSRSGATIVGGLSQGLTKTVATEFSFFLAVPTMFGATLKKLFDYYQNGLVLTETHIQQLLLGNLISFLIAILAIRTFIHFVAKNGFKIFGYYRIFLGVIILLVIFFKTPQSIL